MHGTISMARKCMTGCTFRGTKPDSSTFHFPAFYHLMNPCQHFGSITLLPLIIGPKFFCIAVRAGYTVPIKKKGAQRIPSIQFNAIVSRLARHELFS